MLQYHLFISGKVQGVGFRYFIKNSAKQNYVVGWVRNLSDGRVEAVLQGDLESIERIIAVCRKGPILADVKDVAVTKEEIVNKYNKFLILQTV